MSLEPAGTWAHHRRFRGPGGVTALGIVTTPRAERSTQQRSTEHWMSEKGKIKMLWCRGAIHTCTAGLAQCTTHHTLYSVIPHTALPHCTTLQYTLQYTHHILHHHTARVIYQLGGAQLQTPLHTHHCTHHCGYLVGGPKPACGPYTLTHRDMHVQR